jgi:hypothetical protein
VRDPRVLEAGPYTFIWVDALTQKVREGGRTVNVLVLVATGVNSGGHREILGVEAPPPKTAPVGSTPTATCWSSPAFPERSGGRDDEQSARA